jgi:hypothetical protein
MADIGSDGAIDFHIAIHQQVEFGGFNLKQVEPG